MSLTLHKLRMIEVVTSASTWTLYHSAAFTWVSFLALCVSVSAGIFLFFYAVERYHLYGCHKHIKVGQEMCGTRLTGLDDLGLKLVTIYATTYLISFVPNMVFVFFRGDKVQAKIVFSLIANRLKTGIFLTEASKRDIMPLVWKSQGFTHNASQLDRMEYREARISEAIISLSSYLPKQIYLYWRRNQKAKWLLTVTLCIPSIGILLYVESSGIAPPLASTAIYSITYVAPLQTAIFTLPILLSPYRLIVAPSASAVFTVLISFLMGQALGYRNLELHCALTDVSNLLHKTFTSEEISTFCYLLHGKRIHK